LQYEKKGIKLKTNFGVFFAVGQSHLSSPAYDLYVSDYKITKNIKFKPTLTYEIGTTFNLYIDYAGRNNYCIQLSPSLNTVTYNSDQTLTLYQLTSNYKLEAKYTALKIPLLLKYSFYSSNWPIIPFLRVGLGYAKYLEQKGTYVMTSYYPQTPAFQPNVYTSSLNDYPKPSKGYYIIGGGMDLKCGEKRVSFAVNYEQIQDILEGNRSDIQLQLGFQF